MFAITNNNRVIFIKYFSAEEAEKITKKKR